MGFKKNLINKQQKENVFINRFRFFFSSFIAIKIFLKIQLQCYYIKHPEFL